MNNEKKLPENFVIEYKPNHPLWIDYIYWFNKQSVLVRSGNASEAIYYGRLSLTGWDNYFGYQINKEDILTLEEWDSIVNHKEEKDIPQIKHLICRSCKNQ